MAKELIELNWIEDHLPLEHVRKRMFGGFSYYVDEKLLLVLFESTGNREYRGLKIPYEIWNGCMFPAEKEFHSEILKEFPFLVNHPILPKWLYLPIESEDFESKAESVLKELRKNNPWFGSYPKARGAKGEGGRKRSSSRKATEEDDDLENIDTRTPRMFSDAPAAEVLHKAQKISDLKNLGAEAEKAFAKAGIKTAQQLFKLGWKGAMTRLCKASPKHNHAIMAYAVIGALKNRIWNGLSEEDKKEAREFMKSLRGKSSKIAGGKVKAKAKSPSRAVKKSKAKRKKPAAR